MIDIAGLVPHAGAMVLLERVEEWDARSIRCTTRTHLDRNNPLRRAGVLGAVCGIEYGMQAAALHGALLAGGTRQRAGYVVSVRGARLAIDRLDDPAIDPLLVAATLQIQDAAGLIYDIELRAGSAVLVAARITVALPI